MHKEDSTEEHSGAYTGVSSSGIAYTGVGSNYKLPVVQSRDIEEIWRQLHVNIAQERFNRGTIRCSYGIVQLKNSWEFGNAYTGVGSRKNCHGPTSSTEEQ